MAKNKGKRQREDTRIRSLAGLSAVDKSTLSPDIPEAPEPEPEPIEETLDPFSIQKHVLHGLRETGKKEQPIVDKDHKFINPYTFVPLKSKSPSRGSVERGDKTGVIECNLQIVSPTFIPNTTGCATEQSGLTAYDFFSYDNLEYLTNEKAADLPNDPPKQPVIPGSEIRGMVRNVYEQLTNSCLPIIDEKNIPYRRTAVPKTPYVLRKVDGDWELFKKPAVYKLGSPDHPDDSGYHLDAPPLDPASEYYHSFTFTKSVKGRVYEYITELERSTAETTGALLLHVTGPMEDKHHTLFDPTSGAGGITWSNREDALRRFELVLDNYCNPGTETNAQQAAVFYEKYRKRYEAGEPILVYADEKLTYLSPASMTKEVFEKTINDLLRDQHGHNRCESNQKACPACRLFGMVGVGSEGGAIASRVRFADAAKSEEVDPEWDEPRILPILAAPKLSATEFYLLKPDDNADVWNYDYWNCWKRGKIAHFDKGEIAGRKVYWHGALRTNTTIEQLNMRQKVRSLKAGTFIFKVYFEDLSDQELTDLVFALRLNGEGIHKIGRGKPIGMGDVKVNITKIRLRRYEWDGDSVRAMWIDEDSSSQKFDYVSSSEIESCIKVISICKTPLDSTKPEVARILAYSKPLEGDSKNLVDYPRNNRDGEIFEWFRLNRYPATSPSTRKSLPRL